MIKPKVDDDLLVSQLRDFMAKLDVDDFIHQDRNYHPHYLAISIGWDIQQVFDTLVLMDASGMLECQDFPDGQRVRLAPPELSVVEATTEVEDRRQTLRRLPRWVDYSKPFLPRALIGLTSFLHEHWTGLECPACAGKRLGYDERCLVCDSQGIDALERMAQTRRKLSPVRRRGFQRIKARYSGTRNRRRLTRTNYVSVKRQQAS